jgi:ABC-type lipoprotein release transport system permease subunit
VFILSFKIFIRKSGTAQSIIAIALLVAIVSSANAIINYLNLQSETLAGLISPGGTYLILSSNSTALTDSRLPADLSEKISNLSYINNIFPQKMLTANLTTNSNITITVRGVKDISSFLNSRGAYVNGTVAKNWTEANVGEVLARALSIKLGDEIKIASSERSVKVKVVGIFRSQTQCDSEILVSMETANILSGNNLTISFIEFSLKENENPHEALSQIAQLLPKNTKLVQVQQLKAFAQQINMQVVTFLNIWSIAVYSAVALASYIVSTRLVIESSYELSMLKALGAKRHQIFTIMLAYIAIIAFISSILGISLGIAGTQAVSTMFRWMLQNVDITPFLEVEQATQIFLLTLISSIIGCIHPVIKSAHTRYVEQTL